ncbi:tripartite tricarboxylate transporter TctB family protein [Stutzerimonas urumqiensis]|uniref:tripartite tricarboxylate transporter TctB family protein n=1 Tax=Stutzerimonas urumqiensis TaxID=638269 RepID=UPI000EAC7B00|nr:tripartite tricarboxylate transporter TctB family protein [Stutzerimonas urumqiensis]
MKTIRMKELAIGIAMLAIGLIYLAMTMQLPDKGLIDSAFVPYILAGTICLLGVLQLLASRQPDVGPLTTEEKIEAEAEKAAGASDYGTVAKTLGLIVIYAGLLNLVGFPIMTALYLYVQFLVLTPTGHKTNHLAYVAIAIISSATIYVAFRYGFDLMLPSGPLFNF